MRSGAHTPSERRVGIPRIVRASDRVANGRPCIGTEGGTRRVLETEASGRTGCRSLPSCRSQKVPVWNVLVPWPEAITHVWRRTQEIGRGLSLGLNMRAVRDLARRGRDASLWDAYSGWSGGTSAGSLSQRPQQYAAFSLTRGPTGEMPVCQVHEKQVPIRRRGGLLQPAAAFGAAGVRDQRVTQLRPPRLQR